MFVICIDTVLYLNNMFVTPDIIGLVNDPLPPSRHPPLAALSRSSIVFNQFEIFKSKVNIANEQ